MGLGPHRRRRRALVTETATELLYQAGELREQTDALVKDLRDRLKRSLTGETRTVATDQRNNAVSALPINCIATCE